MDTKVCTKCKIEKSCSEFSKKTQNKDGLNNWCRECNKQYLKLYHQVPGYSSRVKPHCNVSKFSQEDIIQEWRCLYVDELQSPPEIAEKYNCSPITITNQLKKIGIKLRSCSEAQKVLGRTISQEQREQHSERMSGEGNPMYGKKRTENAKKQIGEGLQKYYDVHPGAFLGKKHTEETKQKMKEILRTEETNQKISKALTGTHLSEETKKKISISCKGLVVGERNWMYGKTGRNCPHYIDGRSFLPYPPEFDKTLKRKILSRDANRCHFPQCNTTQNLCPHHIDYNKFNSIEENLITLCISHNSKVNFNREYWMEYFQKLIKER